MSAEDDLIARHFAPLAGPAGLGLNDDAALLLPPAGCELVLTADAIVAGVHFFAEDPAASIGRKALGVNLSDLAAKGAEPLGFLMTLAIPKAWSDQKRERWLDGFASGLAMLARTAGCPLVGGDTVSTPGPLSVSITAYGSVPAGGLIRRTGAQPGDAVLVTGTIGDAALGLRLRENPQAEWAKTLNKTERTHLEERYLHPRPRNLLATHLRGVAHAAMDVSDGLVGDLSKLAGASGEKARLEAALVPLSDAARKALAADPSLWETVLTGGDDYELLITLPPDRMTGLTDAASRAGMLLTRIGSIAPSTASRYRFDKAHARDPLVVIGADGKPVTFKRLSFSHV